MTLISRIYKKNQEKKIASFREFISGKSTISIEENSNQEREKTNLNLLNQTRH